MEWLRNTINLTGMVSALCRHQSIISCSSVPHTRHLQNTLEFIYAKEEEADLFKKTNSYYPKLNSGNFNHDCLIRVLNVLSYCRQFLIHFYRSCPWDIFLTTNSPVDSYVCLNLIVELSTEFRRVM